MFWDARDVLSSTPTWRARHMWLGSGSPEGAVTWQHSFQRRQGALRAPNVLPLWFYLWSWESKEAHDC